MLAAWLWGAVSVIATLAFLRAARVAPSFRFLEDEPAPGEGAGATVHRLRGEDPSPVEPEAPAPSVSALVAARDEGAAVTAGVGSLLTQEGVRMQVVAVDDRSGDDTGPRLRALAAAHEAVTTLAVDALPQGWLGKVHALARADEVATGEWRLLTDADVQLAPGAVARAIARCEREGLDHLTVIPKYLCPSRPLEVLVAASNSLLLAGTRAHEVGVPGRRAFVGVGAFNLVRSTTWARSEGFEWLKMEVLDDMGVALAVQRAGGRSGLALSRGAVAVEWYPSVAAMARGLGKVLWANARFSGLRMLLQAVLLTGLALGPWLALLSGARAAQACGATALVALVGLAVARARRGLQPVWLTLLGPLGQLGLSGFTLLALARGRLARGLVWRETTYRFAALRAGQRVWRRRGTMPWPERPTAS